MSGNGVDLGTVVAMLHTVIQAQTETNRRLDRFEAEVRSEFDAVRKDVRSEFAAVRKEMQEGFTSLREEVRLFGGSVSAHGIIISDLDDRVHKLEDRDNPSRAA